MNISLDRLIEGIIATLRTDVIPHVGDSYARGQAVGVIDLLNNIGPRVEWARQPLIDAVREKRALLEQVRCELPQLAAPAGEAPEHMDVGALALERDALDAAIGDAIKLSDGGGAAGCRVLALLVGHLRDEASRQLKMTRKPLFAEIASGRDEKVSTTGS